jgi:hypothetical protein
MKTAKMNYDEIVLKIPKVNIEGRNFAFLLRFLKYNIIGTDFVQLGLFKYF